MCCPENAPDSPRTLCNWSPAVQQRDLRHAVLFPPPALTLAVVTSSALPAVHVRDLVRPRLRGVLHQWAALTSVLTGALLVLLAEGTRAKVATGIYAGSVTSLFATSAFYHRITWSVRARNLMQRLDHSMIFVLIAGTYTPFGLVVLQGTPRAVVLSVVWGGAALGVTMKMLWHHAPRWVMVPVYLALGWVAAFFVPQLLAGGGVTAFVLLCVGGAIYSVGAFAYATRRPDPFPSTFGYHEVFHACTLVAALLHYLAVFFAINH